MRVEDIAGLEVVRYKELCMAVELVAAECTGNVTREGHTAGFEDMTSIVQGRFGVERIEAAELVLEVVDKEQVPVRIRNRYLCYYNAINACEPWLRFRYRMLGITRCHH